MVDQTRLLALFRDLVATDSPSHGERAMCDRIKGYLTDLGLETEEDNAGEKTGGNAGNLLCRVPGALPLPPLVLCAHMDTVEPSRGKQAVVHPDGRITSGGDTVLGADDCAGIAAILEAVTALRQSGTPHRPLELLFSAAEELYCVGIQAFDFSRLASREGYVLDMAGPVGGAAYQAPTILSFSLTFLGKAAHAGFAPENGIHAVKAAAEAVTGIPCGRVGACTVNVGTIQGGTGRNIVPDRCTLTGEIRSYSDEAAHRCMEEILQTAQQAADRWGTGLETEQKLCVPAYCTDRSHPVVRRFHKACERVGLTPYLRQTMGGSDNNYLARNGIPGLVVATAMNQCHTTGEYTTVEELTRAARLTLELILTE